jgi:hypothetical protein
MNFEHIDPEIIARMRRTLETDAPHIDWSQLFGTGEQPELELELEPELDEFDLMLTLHRTLQAFGELTGPDQRTHLTLSAIARFVAGLTDGEILALTDLPTVQAAAEIALGHLSVAVRQVAVRGLHKATDGMLDLSVDIQFAAGLQFRVNPIGEIETRWPE